MAPVRLEHVPVLTAPFAMKTNRPVALYGAAYPVTVGVTTTAPLVVKAGCVVGAAESHENVSCPLLPSVTLLGVADVFAQSAVIPP